MTDVKIIRRGGRVAFDGRIFKVDVDRAQLPDGREITLEVVRHAASVVLLPLPDAGHVVLVRQYRYPIDRWVWELPAGTVDPGEAPDAAARRECHEEIGKIPRRLERLGSLFPTPGYCDEEMIFYRLDGLDQPATAAHLDEDEVLEPRTFALNDVRTMIQRGEILDMKTVAGLLLLLG
ncbi:MAG: NUDIX hydrolase [Vicinamibacterales bacterium]